MNKFDGLSSKTYLTRSLLNKIFNKKLSLSEIEDMILKGKLTKHFAYYHLTDTTLKELNIVPDIVVIQENFFNTLAKKSAFVLKDISEIFNANKDTTKLIADKYFTRRWNYYYKNELLENKLADGVLEYEI